MEPIREPTGDLLRGVADDMKAIAEDEVALARSELGRSARVAASAGAGTLFGASLAVIGLGLLAGAAVVALDAVIESLAVRMLLMSVVYLGVGAAVARSYGKRLRRDAKPDLSRVRPETQRTENHVKEELQHA